MKITKKEIKKELLCQLSRNMLEGEYATAWHDESNDSLNRANQIKNTVDIIKEVQNEQA